jgi:lipid II:glycine glycyltransferase (peptidoglycan interpeptide bridge formation enzyme)
MNWKGFKDYQTTIEIDLKKDLETLWNNLDKDARWGVKKAEKEYLIFEESEDWDTFYEMYKNTLERGKVETKEKGELQKLAAKLFVIKKEEKIIAGAAIKIQDRIVKLYLNASEKEFLKFQPNNCLYWNILKWSKENGFEIFDLGGYQENARKGDKLYEINRFKQRWGGEIKRINIYSKNFLWIIGRKLIRNSRILWELNNKIRKRC